VAAGTLDCVGVGSDLLLLAVERKSGRVRSRPKLGVALAAADLVELVLAGCVALDGDRLTVVAQEAPYGPVGTVLRGLADSARPITATYSISDRGASAFGVHLREAKRSRVLAEAPRRGGEGFTPLAVIDQTRALGAAQRLVAVARAATEPAAGDTAGLADLAYVMLADAVGLTRVHLGGLSNRKARAWLASQADRRGGGHDPEHSVRVIVRIARRRIEQTPDRPGDGPVPMGDSTSNITLYGGSQ
jgi:hypothetical protein